MTNDSVPDNQGGDWVVQAPKPKYEELPVGMYASEFAKVEEVVMDTKFITKAGDDGKRWRWSWCVATGQHTGKCASALTDKNLNPNSQAGRLIRGLLGRDLQVGENVKASIDACVGKRYLVQVAPGLRGGKPAVRSVNVPPEM
jgi:hypothetical protein